MRPFVVTGPNKGAEEPNSTLVNIKMCGLFRSACHTLSDLFVFATVKPAGIRGRPLPLGTRYFIGSLNNR